MITKRSTVIDEHVGARLRALRWARGITQVEIGRGIGVSFQQLQKYEHGHNRISAGRLFELAQLLDVEIEAFFEGLDRTEVRPLQPRPSAKPRLDPVALIGRIRDPRVRKRVMSLLRVLAAEDEEAPPVDPDSR